MRRLCLIALLLAVVASAALPALAQESGGQKYVLTWQERPHGSHQDYEDAQRRVLQLFQQWKAPDGVTFHQFLVRVGELGGFAVIETDDLKAVHEATIPYSIFSFTLHPVIDVEDAAEAEGNAISWRESVGPLQ